MSAYVDEPSIIQLTLYLDVRSRVIPKKINLIMNRIFIKRDERHTCPNLTKWLFLSENGIDWWISQRMNCTQLSEQYFFHLIRYKFRIFWSRYVWWGMSKSWLGGAAQGKKKQRKILTKKKEEEKWVMSKENKEEEWRKIKGRLKIK